MRSGEITERLGQMFASVCTWIPGLGCLRQDISRLKTAIMPVPENELLQNWNAVTRMTACRNMKGSSNAAQDPHETNSSKKGIRPIPSAEVRRPTAPLSRSRLLANSLTIDEIFFRTAKRSRLHYEFPSLARPLPSFPPPMGEAADIGGGKGLAIPPIYRKDMSQGVRKCFPR